MKLALLLCSLGWLGSPFPSCTGSYLDGTDVDPAENANMIPEVLFRSARTADPDYSQGGGDVMVDYRTLKSIMGPRRHRFLHFGRKRALPQYTALSTDPQGNDEADESDDAYRSAEMWTSEVADESTWLAKRSLSDSSNMFINFGNKFQDGRQIRYKRETGNVIRLKKSGSREMDQYTPDALVIHNDVDDYDTDASSNIRQRNKRSSNRMLHFGKRRQGYDAREESSYDHVQDDVKRATNKMLHFGKITGGDTATGEMEEIYGNEDDEVKLSSNRVLQFGKSKPDLSRVRVSLVPGFRVSATNEKRANRILHFGKRNPDLPGTDVPLLFGLEHPGIDEKRADRILHFGKRLGADMYPAESYEDLYKRTETKRSPQDNRILHFGKREERKSSPVFEVDDPNQSKRTTNNMLHFGKRRPFGRSSQLRDELQSNFQLWKKRSSNRILHFGKRQDSYFSERPANVLMNTVRDEDHATLSNEYKEARNLDKRFKNSMLHFGKRGDEPSPRTQNRIMHFGKRDGDLNVQHLLEVGRRPGDRVLPIGQKITYNEGVGGTDKRLDYLLRQPYGSANRENHKIKTNRLLHFGKRTSGGNYDDTEGQMKSLENVPAGSEDQKGSLNDSGPTGGGVQFKRTKRSLSNVEKLDDSLERVLSHFSNASYPKRFPLENPSLLGTLHLPHAVVAARVYGNTFPRMLSRPSRSDRFFPVMYSGEHRDMPKGTSRNVFLHFG